MSSDPKVNNQTNVLRQCEYCNMQISISHYARHLKRVHTPPPLKKVDASTQTDFFDTIDGQMYKPGLTESQQQFYNKLIRDNNTLRWRAQHAEKQLQKFTAKVWEPPHDETKQQ